MLKIIGGLAMNPRQVFVDLFEAHVQEKGEVGAWLPKDYFGQRRNPVRRLANFKGEGSIISLEDDPVFTVIRVYYNINWAISEESERRWIAYVMCDAAGNIKGDFIGGMIEGPLGSQVMYDLFEQLSYRMGRSVESLLS
jgi:hypothetical protein